MPANYRLDQIAHNPSGLVPAASWEEKGTPMPNQEASTECPYCSGPLESGFLATEQKGGNHGLIGILAGGLKCSKIMWTEEFKMGFFGSPKGEDVSTRNAQKKYMAVPALRCPKCRSITFAY
jgi:hypothetical protein